MYVCTLGSCGVHACACVHAGIVWVYLCTNVYIAVCMSACMCVVGVLVGAGAHELEMSDGTLAGSLAGSPVEGGEQMGGGMPGAHHERGTR